METVLQIADPADNTAAPAPSTAGSAARDLRRELASAIEVHRTAADRAAKAKLVAAVAEEAKCQAAMDADRLKKGLDAAEAAATKTQAEALTQAFKAGEPPPPPLLPCRKAMQPPWRSPWPICAPFMPRRAAWRRNTTKRKPKRPLPPPLAARSSMPS